MYITIVMQHNITIVGEAVENIMLRKSPGTLPQRTFNEFHTLARACRVYGLRPFSEPVLVEIKRIVMRSSDRWDFLHWDDRKLSRWFFDHFVRAVPRHEVENRRLLDKSYSDFSLFSGQANSEQAYAATVVDLRGSGSSLMTPDYRLSHQGT